MATESRMTFRRFGRSYHLRLTSADELGQILDLDEAHWVATSAPIDTINCDATLLELVDSNSDGRIRCDEIRLAVRWLLDLLTNADGIGQPGAVLQLDAINTEQPEGRRILESAQRMLHRLGQDEAKSITLEQIRLVKSDVESRSVSEAGVVTADMADDPKIARFIDDIVACLGGVPHPSGAMGVNESQLAAFASDARAFLDWQAKGQIPDGQTATDVMRLGQATGQAFGVFQRVRDKIDQYFAHCRAVAFDPSLAEHLGLQDAELAEADFDDPDSIQQLLAAGPLAVPNPEGLLDLNGQFNPCYSDAMRTLNDQLLRPLLGQSPDKLTESQWHDVCQQMAAFEAWQSSEAGRQVAQLGTEQLDAYLQADYAEAVRELIARSRTTTVVLDNIRLAEKLALYQADLLGLANNFVSFPDLYDPSRRAMFEMGTLIMDGRRFSLAVTVVNRPEHAKVAATSSMFVLYLELERSGQKKLQVAVPVTSGGQGNLCAGKRGIFEDVNGLDWDARVVQIIDNPIGFGEAIISPFRRLGRLLSGKIESLTSAAEKSFDAKATTTMTSVETAAAQPQAAAPAPAAPNRGLMAGGLLMGGGVAIAAVASAVTYVGKAVAENPLPVAGGVGGALLAVLLPTILMAFLKLRRRDLSAILEGSGWGINARMRLTHRQAKVFTHRPDYPPGSRGIRRGWWTLLVVIVVGAIAVGITWRYTHPAEPTPPPDKAEAQQSEAADTAPAAAPPPAAEP